MIHLFFARFLLATSAAEAVTPVGTPIWVPLLIVVILLLMLWWGLTRNQIPAGTAVHAHDADAHTDHTAHAESAAATAVADDLKKIEGIGPKIEGILHDAGITTFAELAAASVATLEKIVRHDAGIRIANPETWPEQAQLAATGQWEALDTLQETLIAGRRPD